MCRPADGGVTASSTMRCDDWPPGSCGTESGPATESVSGHPTARSGRSCSSRLQKSAAILVTINPAYQSHELEYVLNQAGIETVFAMRRFRSSEYAAMLDDDTDGMPTTAARGDHRGRRVAGPGGWRG